jgi:acyl-CoA synthetase (AMP-forming)/AMP-acid ligase II
MTAESRPGFCLASRQIGTCARPAGPGGLKRERVAAYKYPRVIEIQDELPKNALGKILKDQLLP